CAVVTNDRDVYVIPVCRLFFPYNQQNIWPFFEQKNQTIHQNPSIKDYIKTNQERDLFLDLLKEISICNTKKLRPKKKELNITCCHWWTSFTKEHYLLVGDSRGRIIFFNLQSRKEECVAKLKGNTHSVKSIEFIRDPQKRFQYAFITAMKGNFYKLLLEQLDEEYQIYRTIIQDYENHRSKPFSPILEEQFSKEYPCKVIVQDDPKKKISYLISFSKLTHQLNVYGSEST